MGGSSGSAGMQRNRELFAEGKGLAVVVVGQLNVFEIGQPEVASSVGLTVVARSPDEVLRKEKVRRFCLKLVDRLEKKVAEGFFIFSSC